MSPLEGQVQRDLVERAQRGDRESFESLAQMSIAWLYNVAQLMLADSDLAQDAVQETLVVTWRDLRGLRDPDRFDAWLRRILVRCVYRPAKGERRQAERERLASGDDTSPDSAGELADRDEIDRVFRRIKAEYPGRARPAPLSRVYGPGGRRGPWRPRGHRQVSTASRHRGDARGARGR